MNPLCGELGNSRFARLIEQSHSSNVVGMQSFMINEAPQDFPCRPKVTFRGRVVRRLEDSRSLFLRQLPQVPRRQSPSVLEQLEDVPREVLGEVDVEAGDVPPFDDGNMLQTVVYCPGLASGLPM